MIVADYCFIVFMAFLTRVFRTGEVHTQDFSELNARLQVRACGVILFLLVQFVYMFVRGIEIQNLVDDTRFDPVLLLSPIG